MQEAGEEARQEAEGREHGPLGETHPPEDQLKVSVLMQFQHSDTCTTCWTNLKLWLM